MSEFWQYFAVGLSCFIAGMILGRAMGITQMLLRQQQQMSQLVMPSGMPTPGPSRTPGLPNGPV